MRIAIGGISHESSTFALTRTTMADFEEHGVSAGAALLEKYTGTKTPLGGFIDAGRDFAWEVIPVLSAAATPGGVIAAETIDALLGGLCERLREALPLDGVLLSLHGGMVCEQDDDGESYILRAIRAVVGPDCPVIVELDIHGNITREMVGLASVVVAFDEYPHTDTYERGYECGVLMTRILRGGVRPTAHIVHIPMIDSGERQYSHAEPMLGVKHLAHDIEGVRGVLNASYFTGFAWADIPYNAWSVIVTTDGVPDLARREAERLATFIWERRAAFEVRPVSVDDAVRRAMAAPAGPVVLADLGDSSGSGAPTDGTVLLEGLLRLGARRTALAAFADPDVVRQAGAAGEGAWLHVTLGGKVDRRHGEPLEVRARVARLTGGTFTVTGSMGTGSQVHLGPTAVLEVEGRDGGSVQVVVTTNRYQPTDLGVFRAQGIEPAEQQILVVKSNVHFRAAFGPIAAEVIEVDTPGLSSPRLDLLAYHRIPRPIYPFDRDMHWSPSADA